MHFIPHTNALLPIPSVIVWICTVLARLFSWICVHILPSSTWFHIATCWLNPYIITDGLVFGPGALFPLFCEFGCCCLCISGILLFGCLHETTSSTEICEWVIDESVNPHVCWEISAWPWLRRDTELLHEDSVLGVETSSTENIYHVHVPHLHVDPVTLTALW